jgi:hypothetical protein
MKKRVCMNGKPGVSVFPPHWPMATSLHDWAGQGRSLYDPLAEARRTAARIAANRAALSLDGLLAETPWVPRGDLAAALVAYHKDAMGRIPSATRYPEAQPFVEQVLRFEKELRRLANLDDLGVATVMSLGRFLLFRGRRQFGLRRPAQQAERCRILLHLETDRGPFMIKNVDDPPRNWKPAPALPPRMPRSDYWWEQVEWVADGTGSGLHLEDEPSELFPLPAVWVMASEHAHDTPGVVDFVRRYSPFFGGGNLLVYDRQLRLAAIEKSSHNHCEVFPPEDGRWAHISGMVCRDPASPHGRYQTACREAYLRLYGLPADGPDAAFWMFCDEGERMLVDGVRQLGNRPKVNDIIELFRTPYPGGLCKGGHRFHKDQAVTEYTLWTYAHLIAERKYLRWQRGEDLSVWPADPETCEFV